MMDTFKFGYDFSVLTDYGQTFPILSNITTAPHLLLAGASGSGKSYALLFYLWQLAKLNLDFWMLDFKNSEDFRFLSPYNHFYVCNECIDAIDAFYEEFQQTKQSAKARDRPLYLICDEFPALILYLEGLDKKKATELKNKVAEILMLGRSWGFGIWITTQRPDANFFSNGARDNFMTVIALGRISPQAKGMLFAGETIPERPYYKKGEGFILMDGSALQEIKVPQISSIQLLKTRILQYIGCGNFPAV